MSRRAQDGLLLAAAVFAMVWALARAIIQSITIDEAASYLVFVRNPQFFFFPAANNHLLNTLLEALTTKLFGLRPWTVRAPALLGAALYVSASYRVSRRLAESLAVRLPLFVCLVYNPFVFDYLVAARGYGLAIGFFMWAIAAQLTSSSGFRPALISSACLGLSISANLSFAVVDSITLAAILFVTLSRTHSYARSLGATALPALSLTALLSGAMILRMPKQELWWGSTSLRDMFSGILTDTLSRPISTKLFHAGSVYLPWLFGTALALCAAHQFWRSKPDWRCRFGAILAGILATTLAVHWILFRTIHLLLPKDRTGLYIVPLILVLAGAFAAIPAESFPGRALRAALTAVLVLIAGYFVSCLRLTYFEQWRYDADVADVYSVLACLNHDRGVSDVATFWMYAAPLNYYRQQSGRETLMEFQGEVPYRPEQLVLVLNAAREPEVVSGRGLRILYRAKSTEAVIAATPDAEPLLRSSVCLDPRSRNSQTGR